MEYFLITNNMKSALLCFVLYRYWSDYEALNDIFWICAIVCTQSHNLVNLLLCHAIIFYQLQARQVLFVDSVQSGFLKIIRICFSRLGRSRWVGNLMDLVTKDTKAPQGWSKIQAHLDCHSTPRPLKAGQRHEIFFLSEDFAKSILRFGWKVTSQHIVFTAFG